ncbi:Hypothetical predicted protein [Olea europaea subsp. europaea]|uniref:Uncharacterized protein n=1 Tax=Olea europaea subsp. europaea TaxID=158383 RepID=A0A8S0Q7Q5_OLEEU|nr:Hypothetical predicted protein [Olea europaea subsp. europaea]
MYVTVSEDDSDFVDSENNVEDEDDTLYEQNVTDGIEIGLDGHYQIQDEWGESNDMEVDALEYPTEELLSQCSSDEESGFRFPQFSAKTDMKNPQFVGKMVAIGGKSSSSIVTTPINDEHEDGQPVEDTVATVEVDFEEMAYKNCGRA